MKEGRRLLGAGGRKGRVDTTGQELEKGSGRDIKLLIVKVCHPSALLLRRNLVVTFLKLPTGLS